MTSRARVKRLENLGPLTTHFRRRSGKVSHYHEFRFFDDGDRCVSGWKEEHVTRPFRVNGELIFDKVFKGFRVQRRGATFTTIAIYSLDDRFLGYYSDMTMPWAGVTRLPGGRYETMIDDLYLDHFIFPDGRSFVLDLGELHQGLADGRVSGAEADLAVETVTWLEERHRAGQYPQTEFKAFDSDPRLLRDLPQSQQ